MSQEWLSQRERGTVFAIRTIAWIALRLGRRAGRLALYPAVTYFFICAPRVRAASRNYLARVLGRRPRLGDVFRHLYAFGVVALDRVFFLTHRYDLFDIRIFGEDMLQAALQRGEGCFLLGAHLGSFEALRALGQSKRLRVKLVMYEENARRTNLVARAIDPELASSVISLGRFDSMLKVSEALERGDWVGMLGDRALYDEGHVRVRFLGESAELPASPFRLAAMLKRPVVLMAGLYRGGNRYDLVFEPLIEDPRAERNGRDAAIGAWAQRYASRLEQFCREAPFNWFNFYDFWRIDARS
jgi:predicted LPLAT superfamily acyltransferase